MRAVHRLLALIAVVAMLYLGVTGTMMQAIDLQATIGHAAEDSPTMLSINEGINGNASYAVLSDADYRAAPLPDRLDYALAIATVMRAAAAGMPGVAPRYVELRMDGDRPIGQLQLGPTPMGPPGHAARPMIVAYDAGTGASVPALATMPGRPPHSLRQDLKELHRFWSRRDVPGVWFELLFGIVLSALVATGLVMYVRLLAARARQGRRQLLWLGGGMWRGLHRVVSVLAAVFLVAISLSGTWLGFESVYNSVAHRPQTNSSAPLTIQQAQQMAAATIGAFSSGHPQLPLKVLRMRIYAGMRQGIVVTGGSTTTQLVYDTGTGRTVGLSEPGYPASGFPFGTATHEWVKHFHSGWLFGVTARLFNQLAGLALIYLCVSGIVMYADMWARRRRLGRTDPVWL